MWIRLTLAISFALDSSARPLSFGSCVDAIERRAQPHTSHWAQEKCDVSPSNRIVRCIIFLTKTIVQPSFDAQIDERTFQLQHCIVVASSVAVIFIQSNWVPHFNNISFGCLVCGELFSTNVWKVTQLLNTQKEKESARQGNTLVCQCKCLKWRHFASSIRCKTKTAHAQQQPKTVENYVKHNLMRMATGFDVSAVLQLLFKRVFVIEINMRKAVAPWTTRISSKMPHFSLRRISQRRLLHWKLCVDF